MNEEDKHCLRLSEQCLNDHQCDMRNYEKFTNDIFVDLTKLLITLNTALLTFTSPIISKDLISNLGILKPVLVIAWIFIFISILAGITQLMVEHKYYSNISDLYGRLRLLFADCKGKADFQKAQKDQDLEVSRSFKAQSSLAPFVAQIFSFIFGIILLLFIFSSIVLK